MLLTAGFHLGFSCLLEVQPPPQELLTNYDWSPPNAQVSAMDLTPALCRAFSLDGAILSFSIENPRQAEGINVFCGEIQISFADFHFSHFKGLTSSQGIRAVSKLSSVLGTPVADTPCHRQNKKSVLGSIFQYRGILRISASCFLLFFSFKTMSGF